MSKITFRADADLVDRLEELEGSKSEVMREALREYLDDAEARSDAADAAGWRTDAGTDGDVADSFDDALAARVDELVTARLDEAFASTGSPDSVRADRSRPFGVPGGTRSATPAVNLTVNVDGAGAAVEQEEPAERVDPSGSDEPVSGADGGTPAGGSSGADDAASDAGARSCAQCGEDVADDHVFCPNCGEKTTRRLFCECGDEVRSDWAFCPGCGRRTPAADVLDAT
ncbi:double zinc ribbon domain-containing protein [Halobaculum gomorrense]|uniref:Double zinc ribbon n=1 Tax=Halobaculum gomorrense TaxID=43928 RepID=A0A1M5JPC2_9EURY|nr:zinc ribbon domain-containing protein [Halobaculum gomorrense]SHG42414.1 Double zinc ribbon [Halobaculum gomorrense]